MRAFSILATASLAAVSAAAPAAKRGYPYQDGSVFPLSDGFPTPNTAQTEEIEQRAKGTLSNAGAPTNVSADGLISFQLIALNEVFEVAYFTELLYNVTNKVQGYDLGYGHDYVVSTLTAIVAQEELHALNANAVLKANKKDAIQPCKYSFPVDNFQDAIALAAKFTDVVLGTLQDVNQIFSIFGDNGAVRAVSSVIGQEGEQEGFFRLVTKQIPSSLPFLTTSVRDFAFTAIQGFIVPNSCPNINTIPLTTYHGLNLLTEGTIEPCDQQLKFSFEKQYAKTSDWSTLSIVYINQQNLPVTKPLLNPTVQNDMVVFEADFPFSQFLMNGLTIAAVVPGNDNFTSADAVAAKAIFAPGLIEVVEKLDY